MQAFLEIPALMMVMIWCVGSLEAARRTCGWKGGGGASECDVWRTSRHILFGGWGGVMVLLAV